MSTILDALKRLEDERGQGRGPKAPISMTGRAASPSIFSRRGAGLMIAGLAAMGGAAGLLWINFGPSGTPPVQVGPAPEPPAVTASSAVPRKPAAAAQALKERAEGLAARTESGIAARPPGPVKPEGADGPAPVMRQKVSPTYAREFQAGNLPKRPMPERGATGMRHPVAPDAHGASIDPRPPLTETQSPMPVIEADEKPSPSGPMRAGASAPKTETSPRKAHDPQPVPDQDPYNGVETLPRGAMQLQAISWSHLPSARITVVDGRILREGQSIGGYTVTQIRPDDIIVSKEGKHWRLVYSNQ